MTSIAPITARLGLASPPGMRAATLRDKSSSASRFVPGAWGRVRIMLPRQRYRPSVAPRRRTLCPAVVRPYRSRGADIAGALWFRPTPHLSCRTARRGHPRGALCSPRGEIGDGRSGLSAWCVRASREGWSGCRPSTINRSGPPGTAQGDDPRNPRGDHPMSLCQGNNSTLYHIRGTVEPWTIGKASRADAFA
jgi:hypothetical protein